MKAFWLKGDFVGVYNFRDQFLIMFDDVGDFRNRIQTYKIKRETKMFKHCHF